MILMIEIPRVPALLGCYAREERWVVDCCPLCDRKHTFFAGRYKDPTQYLGLRETPCGGVIELVRFHELSDHELQAYGFDMGL